MMTTKRWPRSADQAPALADGGGGGVVEGCNKVIALYQKNPIAFRQFHHSVSNTLERRPRRII